MSPQIEDKARPILEELRRVGLEERARLDDGGLEQLPPLTRERGELLEQLHALMSEAGLERLPAGALGELVEEVRAQGLENQVLIASMRNEIAQRIAGGQASRRAAKGYEKNGVY